MPYTFKSGQNLLGNRSKNRKTFRRNILLLQDKNQEPEAVEGDPEQAKAMARAFGMPWVS